MEKASPCATKGAKERKERGGSVLKKKKKCIVPGRHKEGKMLGR